MPECGHEGARVDNDGVVFCLKCGEVVWKPGDGDVPASVEDWLFAAEWW